MACPLVAGGVKAAKRLCEVRRATEASSLGRAKPQEPAAGCCVVLSSAAHAGI